jgi:hypothetical protein
MTRLLLAALLLPAAAYATPVEPTMKELLAQPPRQNTEFAPARAGWHGPQTARPAPNLELETFSAASTTRATKAALKAAAMPHPLAIAGVLGMIFLLRRLRTLQPA